MGNDEECPCCGNVGKPSSRVGTYICEQQYHICRAKAYQTDVEEPWLDDEPSA